MFDLHAHIIPSVDDGPGDWDTSLGMLKRAVDDGIRGIVVTPHRVPGLYDNTRDGIIPLARELGERAKARGLPIAVYPGCELAVSAETAEDVKNKDCCTINSGRYLLTELPPRFSGNVRDFISLATAAGLVPLIAHPERNPQILNDIEALYELAGLGALMQVTAASLTGLFGEDPMCFAREMLERRLVHVVASDAHDETYRPPVLSEARAEVSRLAGEKAARAMFEERPLKIINDESFTVPEPARPRKTLLFFSDTPFFD